MSTDLFAVKVVSRNDKVVVFDVRSLDKDNPEVPAEKSFGLMLLHDCAGLKSPLALEASSSEVSDTPWAKRFSNGFIERVAVVKNRLTVTTTHPAWAEHVKPGKSWSSAAFASARGGYTACMPLSPGDREAQAATADAKDAQASSTTKVEAGLMVAPTALWKYDRVNAKTKTILVPGYPPEAFVAVEEITGTFDAKRLKPYLGRAVRITKVKGARGDRTVDGRLQLGSKKNFVLHALSSEGRFSVAHQGQLADISKLGVLALRPSHSQKPYGYREVSEQLPTRVVKVTTSGVTARFTLECAPHGEVNLNGAGAMLAVLVAPIEGQLTQKPRAPLARSLADRAPESEFYADHFTRLARAYVKTFSLDVPKRQTKFEKLTVEQARELFETPLTAELTITVTDEHWLKHLAGVKTFDLPWDFAAPSDLRDLPPRSWKK